MDQAAWSIANTIAQAVSAIGTLAAVGVALYLASHQNAVRLNASVTVGSLVAQGVPGSERGPFLVIRIANPGFRDVRIVSIGWRIGLSRHHFWQSHPVNEWSTVLPKKLEPSDAMALYFPWDTYLKNSEDLRNSLGKHRWARLIRARFTKLVVRSATGETLSLRPSGQGLRMLALGRIEERPPKG